MIEFSSTFVATYDYDDLDKCQVFTQLAIRGHPEEARDDGDRSLGVLRLLVSQSHITQHMGEQAHTP